MDLSKLLYVFLSLFQQNQAEVWARFWILLIGLEQSIELIDSLPWIQTFVVPLAMFTLVISFCDRVFLFWVMAVQAHVHFFTPKSITHINFGLLPTVIALANRLENPLYMALKTRLTSKSNYRGARPMPVSCQCPMRPQVLGSHWHRNLWKAVNRIRIILREFGCTQTLVEEKRFWQSVFWVRIILHRGLICLLTKKNDAFLAT